MSIEYNKVKILLDFLETMDRCMHIIDRFYW
jgi:hypothetical protein